MEQALYDLPEGWEWKELGTISEFQGGTQPPKKEFIYEPSEGYVRFLQIRDFSSNKNITYIAKSKKNRICNEADILIGRYGASVGKILTGKAGAYNVAIIKTAPDTSIVDKQYFRRYLESDLFQHPLINKTSARAAQAGFSKKDIEGYLVPIPPLNEQKRIVAKIDALFTRIDTGITHLQQTLELSKALFASTLDEAMQSNSMDWEKTTIGAISSKVSTGPFGSMLHKSDYISNGIPLVNPVNIVGERIVPDQKKHVSEETKSRLQSYIVSAGDIVLARRGEIGRCAVVTNHESGWICGTGCFFLTPKKKVTPDFLTRLIRSSTYRLSLESVATGATMKNISNKSLSSSPLSLPPLKEQNRIVAYLDALAELTRALEAATQEKLNDLTSLKASLLDAAFKGQL